MHTIDGGEATDWGLSGLAKVVPVEGALIGALIEVHLALGPGLLETAYEACLCRELERRPDAEGIAAPAPIRAATATVRRVQCAGPGDVGEGLRRRLRLPAGPRGGK